jgi:hypothetical protein
MLITLYKDESGCIQVVKLASQNPDEAQELLDLAEHYKPKSEATGSGSERWPDNDWTQAGDGTVYPNDYRPAPVAHLPTQAEADAAARPDPVPVFPSPEPTPVVPVAEPTVIQPQPFIQE